MNPTTKKILLGAAIAGGVYLIYKAGKGVESGVQSSITPQPGSATPSDALTLGIASAFGAALGYAWVLLL